MICCLMDPLDWRGKIYISEGGIISYTVLKLLLPSQLKKIITKYKAICGCELCIIMAQFQASLNDLRLSLLRRLENEANKYESPRDSWI